MPELKPEDKKSPPPPPPKSHEIDLLLKEVMDLKEKVGKLEGMVEVLLRVSKTSNT